MYISKCLEMKMYADDLVLYIKATSIPFGIYYLAQANIFLKKWLEESKLPINTEKSGFMIFSKSHQKNIYPTQRFGQDRIRRVTHHKFLALTID
jgi:hypothetical protein